MILNKISDPMSCTLYLILVTICSGVKVRQQWEIWIDFSRILISLLYGNPGQEDLGYLAQVQPKKRSQQTGGKKGGQWNGNAGTIIQTTRRLFLCFKLMNRINALYVGVA